MVKKSEVIEKLEFLIESAKQRKIKQGIDTFSGFVKMINESEDETNILKNLYQQLSGMQRFADFTNEEWKAVSQLFKVLEKT